MTLAVRIALWSGAAAGGLTLAFVTADARSAPSPVWVVSTTGAFLAAMLPAVTGLAMIGAWRARRRPATARGHVVDGWIAAGLLTWLFFVRLESAHQLVAPSPHVSTGGAANLVLLALAGFIVVRGWERAHDAGRTRALAVTGLAAAVLMAAAVFQDPGNDRTLDAERFAASTTSSTTPGNDSGRVLFLGVDGLDWRLLHQVSTVESLPVLRGLVHKGRRWALDPTGLKRSPEIWSTIHTGQSPEAHGIWGFADWELWNGRTVLAARPYFGPHIPLFVDHLLARLPAAVATPRLVTADGLAVPTFWEAAAADGVPTVVVAPFPFTSPLMAVEGVMAVRDAEAGQWHVARTAGGMTTRRVLSERGLVGQSSLDDEDADLQRMHEERVRLSMNLFQEVTPRLGVFYSSYLDEMLHRHWRDGCPAWGECSLSLEDDRVAVIRRAFRHIDQDLGRLIHAFGADATVVLLSDHGWELGAPEHVFGPDGVLVVSPVPEPGFGGRADIYEVAPSVLHWLRLPAEAAMVGRTVFDRPTPRRGVREIVTRRLRRAARPSADRLNLLKAVGYIAK